MQINVPSRKRIARGARLLGGALFLLTLSQFLVICGSGGKTEWAIGGNGWVGCNGMEARYLWTEDGRSRLAWDDLGGLSFSWVRTRRAIQIRVPTWPFLLLGFLSWYAGRSLTRSLGQQSCSHPPKKITETTIKR